MGEHDLEGVLMRFVMANVVMFHVWLRHGSFVDLFPPEGEDRHSIPEATVYVYQVKCFELFLPCLFLLAGHSLMRRWYPGEGPWGSCGARN